MFRNVYVIGLLIFAVIFSAFIVTNIFFRDVNYYRNSIMLSAFLVPLVCAVGAFISVVTYSKWKKTMSFREAYGRSFIPMFVGGILSVAAIFLYINNDRATKDLLNHQYIESYKKSLEDEYSKAKKIVKPNSPEDQDLEKKYAEAKVRVDAKVQKNEDMFTLKYFAYVFAGYCAFFLILSLFFGSFFRTRSTEIQ